ncbi:MAG: hypothetical protein K2J60_03790 [Acetatifactor sp.]|nr:hypothetical protein [Acetatifactor sp.]
MKNYEEMAASVLERRDKYAADRKRKIRKTASVVSCFCFIAVLGTGIWYAGILNHGRNISDGQSEDAVNDGFLYTGADTATGGILPGGAAIGKTEDNDADIRKEIQVPVGDEPGEGLNGNPAGYPPYVMNAPQQDDEISETDPLDTDVGEYRDKPAVQNSGNTGALTEYEAVWGGSYMDEAGRFVVLLTENTAENQEKVFQLNPTLTEENTVFKEAAYYRSYLVDLMERLSKADLPPVVSTIGFREDRNRIAVYITADDPDVVAEILSYDSIGGAIEIICLSDIQIDENLIK